jgi:G:T-mismatch repair DNA endonuclease (very short patch repair protein)
MKNSVRNRWNGEEIKILRSYYHEEGKLITGRLPQRTWRAISAKAGYLNLTNRKSPIWTKQDLDLLRELRKSKLIRELVSYFPGRTHNALWLKCELMKFKGKREWNQEEEQILKSYFSKSGKETILALLPSRNWCAIQQKARKMRLPPLCDTKEQQRQRFKKLNKDPDFRRKRLKALCRKPTKPERQLVKIIEEHNLPYKYVGDGSFIIEGFNPDFINTNGEKHIIEVFGRVWHDTLVHDWCRTELGRIMVYNSYGYRTLVIWDDEMSNEDAIAKRIINFDRARRKGSAEYHQSSKRL